MTCRDTQRALAAYVDGELGGAQRLQVSSHLVTCATCADEESELRALGDMLRGSVLPAPEAGELGGLAAGVVSRIKAEDRQSWRGRYARLFEDWHWVAVGSGACSGALVSAVAVFAMLYTPTTQARQFNAKVGTLLVMALPEDGAARPNVLEVNGELAAGPSNQRCAVPASMGWRGEQELVSQLDRSLMRSGRFLRLDEMSSAQREEVSQLLQEVARMRHTAMSRRPYGQTNVSAMHLCVTENVTAAGL